ncbi:FUSC family protein [Fundicoccus culcitae]|uniref:Aromatic acid exporter family protein n=1 Tax=Fundicoccus culcitae TaxID=2969821 RepID=A0ABY5P6N7_9LACT|nr:aromatic acid exporter family protein [Fundicoccus culcitae]UUX34145.1 aromatic acid exporter family protein [Fundicoccus culcitae]
MKLRTVKIGPRIIKTGLAVSISILLATYLLPNSTGGLAGIAATLSTMPSVRKSYETLISRTTSFAIGGIISIIMIYIFDYTPIPPYISVGIATVLTIAVLTAINLNDMIGLAVVTVIVIMLSDDPNYVGVAINRVLETLIGVVVSFIINWLVYPPRYDSNFYQTLEYLTSETLVLIRATLRKNTDYSYMHRDIRWSRGQIIRLSSLYDLISNELVLTKKNRYKLAKKLVVYRHLRNTIEVTVDLSEVLHKNDYLYNNFPDEMRIMIRERIEILLTAHEQIMMKLSGKIAPENVNFMHITPEYRKKYVNKFFDEVWFNLDGKDEHADYFDTNGIIHIMSAIYKYEEALHKLNKIVRIYKQDVKGYDVSYDHVFDND